MRRPLLAVPLCALALVLPACDYTNGGNSFPGTSTTGTPTATSKDLVPPQNSRSVSVPSPISPAALRHKTCEDLKPKLDQIRQDSGQPAVDQTVDDTISKYPASPDWPVLTDEQRQAAINGTHDAATGNCPSA
ncbi:hypothetical protein [Nocardia sp. NBC_00511]|uniref:hypothetical protein n=1 Tax=Nocardia sp. NBC_00511 TaxID=2903591 RepID=UPI0030E34021